MGNYSKDGIPTRNDLSGPKLVCPFCKTDIALSAEDAACQICGKTFPLKNGIICFGKEDAFYEGKFTKTKEHSSSDCSSGLRRIFKTLYRTISISTFETRFFEKSLNAIIPNNEAKILDFGCGGGAEILPRFGSVTGVDLSVSSLLEVRQLYDRVYQIDGDHLPFPEAFFDCVYTSHVFGHIPLNRKTRVIAEIYRVLKPGGYLISSIECDSESIVYKKAKKHPELFSKCYVEEWGHYGLELPQANFKRFREAGFLAIVELADIHKGYLRPITSYKNLLAYKGKDSFLYGLGAVSNFINKRSILTRAIDFSFGLMIPISFIFTPSTHRDSAKIVYRKPEKLCIHDYS